MELIVLFHYEMNKDGRIIYRLLENPSLTQPSKCPKSYPGRIPSNGGNRGMVSTKSSDTKIVTLHPRNRSTITTRMVMENITYVA